MHGQRNIKQNQILAYEQYGFRSNLSTDNISYSLTHENLSAMNNKHIVGGIFCDLSKAFDCVNHRILLLKLEHYGIRGAFRTLIKSCLTDRHQRVAIKDKTNTINYSNWELVKHGEQQGSILGHLCFVLYTNNLPTVTSKCTKLVLYADGTSFINTNSSPTEFANRLNKVLADVNEWFKNNLLFLNLNKTTHLQFRTNNSQKLDFNIILRNNQITMHKCTSTKFLCLAIEETLSWKRHINQILSKLSLACYAIRVITSLMSEDTLKIVYHSYVHSIMTCGIIFWGNSP